MLDLTVMAVGGRWLLVDDDAGELGAYESRAAALRAAAEYEAFVDDEPRHVLVQESSGEWGEAVVEPSPRH